MTPVHQWASQPDISARSVLVTIFGDTVLPVTRELWLAQLFRLTRVFGFSDRLTRTSMFRLAEDGWLTNERVGRQSRYRLTDLAVEESAQAEPRIYQASVPEWEGQWSLVILDGPQLSAETASEIREHLQWNGFVRLSPRLLGSPTVPAARVQDLVALIAPGTTVPIATAEFAGLDSLVGAGFFSEGFNLEEIAASYRSFIERYGALPEASDEIEAFAFRTMLVHDLRRIRLRTPDLPAGLLPTDWAGDAALELAGRRYRQFSEAAAPVLTSILSEDVGEAGDAENAGDGDGSLPYPSSFESRFPKRRVTQA